MTISTVAGVVAAILIAVIVLTMVGCGQSAGAYAGCRQAVIATDAGVITSNALLSAGTISKTDAAGVLLVAAPAAAAETAWKAALDAGDQSVIDTAAAAAQAALGKLSNELLALQQRKGLKLTPAIGRAKLGVAALRSRGSEEGESMPVIGGQNSKKSIDLSATVAIIQLVADLSPQIVAWINAASAKTVSAADVQASLDTLNRDIALLQAAVQ